MLGAAEFVLDVEDPAHQKALNAATALSMKANRALVLAVTAADGRLQPAVLLSFSEKLRPDAAQTIAYFDAQGVAVRIISGDSPQTVKALAERAGVQLTGEAFDARSLPEGLDEIAEILERNQILGRVTPEQKRNIVLAMQGRGRVVAMIGDGVNDMLALKKADLGIAMSGATAATKSVSNIVLLDSKFDSLPSVVGEGRRVIANIERVSNLFLTKTAWSMTLAIVFGLAMMSFPFLPRQLSAIDSFAIGIPAFFLALLPNPKRYEPGFLARTLRFCVPSGVAVGLAVALLNVLHRSEPLPQLQTATSVLLAITGLWVLTSLSLPLDRWRVAILATMYLGVVGIFLVPVSSDFFAFTSLSAPLAFSTAALTALCCALTSVIARLAANQHSKKA
jgi:cation-transporting ATPase E